MLDLNRRIKRGLVNMRPSRKNHRGQNVWTTFDPLIASSIWTSVLTQVYANSNWHKIITYTILLKFKNKNTESKIVQIDIQKAYRVFFYNGSLVVSTSTHMSIIYSQKDRRNEDLKDKERSNFTYNFENWFYFNDERK
ncbi:hypothetical protein BpHYR1_032858 [Brachionus plicatilis]|uniref:Uncharacterized protein n=1 Tax=Brachionus plicatilis TaxID=10195 RepID=A0A3M7PQJ7_BRAPC|nr:hypothetical protein BpHYR1_032858 [Brachionus plicatilis]